MPVKKLKPVCVYVAESDWTIFVNKHKSASKRVRELIKEDLESSK